MRWITTNRVITVFESFASRVTVGLHIHDERELIVEFAAVQVESESEARIDETSRVWLMLLWLLLWSLRLCRIWRRLSRLAVLRNRLRDRRRRRRNWRRCLLRNRDCYAAFHHIVIFRLSRRIWFVIFAKKLNLRWEIINYSFFNELLKKKILTKMK